MVDTVSSAKTIRPAGSATARYAASPASASNPATVHPVTPVAATDDATHRDQGGHSEHDTSHEQEPAQNLRLEIGEDSNGTELVYRFVDTVSGEVVREWPAGEFGKLRDYMHDKKIHLLDKKI